MGRMDLVRNVFARNRWRAWIRRVCCVLSSLRGGRWIGGRFCGGRSRRRRWRRLGNGCGRGRCGIGRGGCWWSRRRWRDGPWAEFAGYALEAWLGGCGDGELGLRSVDNWRPAGRGGGRGPSLRRRSPHGRLFPGAGHGLWDMAYAPDMAYAGHDMHLAALCDSGDARGSSDQLRWLISVFHTEYLARRSAGMCQRLYAVRCHLLS